MRRNLLAMLLATSVAMPVAASAQDLNSLCTQELLPLAQKEGSVTVFSLSSRIAKVEAAFEAAYPGIDMVGVDLSSAKQIARVVAEQQAGVYAVDVLYLADTPVVYRDLFAPGRVQNYVPPRVADQLADTFE